MKSNFFHIILVILIPFFYQGQVGINTDSPNTSSVLHIVGPNKTMMPPKVSVPSNFSGKTVLKSGFYFDDRTGQKCFNYILIDGTLSKCILTVDDVATSVKYNTTLSSGFDITSLTYKTLVNNIDIPVSTAPRRIFISFDLSKIVTVATDGQCAATDLRLSLLNNTTGVSTVLYTGQTFITPRESNTIDVYPFTQTVYSYLEKNQSYSIICEYKKAPTTTCSPSTDKISAATMTAVTY